MSQKITKKVKKEVVRWIRCALHFLLLNYLPGVHTRVVRYLLLFGVAALFS